MSFAQIRLDHRCGEVSFSSMLVHAESVARQPGLLMFPNALGLGERALETAHELSGLGYAVLVADMYGAGVRPSSLEEGSKLARAVRDQPGVLRARVNALLALLREQPVVDAARVAAVGFCFGGSCALELARSGADLPAVASLHGGLSTPQPAQAGVIKARVFVLHGADDPFVPAADVRAFEDEMRSAGADWQLIEFGNTVHSFADKGANVPGKAVFNPKVARRAFRMLDDYFADAFAESVIPR